MTDQLSEAKLKLQAERVVNQIKKGAVERRGENMKFQVTLNGRLLTFRMRWLDVDALTAEELQPFIEDMMKDQMGNWWEKATAL